MLPDGLHDIDLAELENSAGANSYARGVRYARQGAVRAVRWEPSRQMLHGTVAGQADVYETSASFYDNGPALEFELGECSCPVGYNCKHVVALVLTALGGGRPSPAPSRRPRVPTWEESLGALLDSRSDGLASRPGDTPLAVELTLAPTDSRPAGQAPRVLARLVRPGRNTWVNSGLSWTRLSSPYYLRDYRQSQVRLLQELYALYRSSANPPGYHSAEVKSIDLSAFGSPRLWSVLDEAATIGLELVHGRKRLGAVEPYGSARLVLDVTQAQPAGPLVVNPILSVAGASVDAAPAQFIGGDGHGVVYVDRAEIRRSADHKDWHLRLARLTEPVPQGLQRMAVENGRLEIPAAEQIRFRDEYYPRLRHLAPVISSDESFTPPAISAPTLVLRASYGGEHRVDLDWEWAYQVGHRQLREPLGQPEPDAGHRDRAAERATLASLDVSLERFGLLDTDPVPVLTPHAELRGIDTMRFTTEVLPLLADQPGVAVEIGGTRADYREAGDSLTIGVSTDEVPGDTDWFDLGITITVEGREVPFIEVFLALSREQSHMLLADGAYFSLEKPELRTLRGLIEEARALRESSDGTLKISRFQVGLWDELTELGVVNRQAEAWQRQARGLLCAESIDATPVPASLTARLRPYQLDGYRWLTFLWDAQLGGILADDMGLGKTLQSLALICHARQADPDGAPFLIVAPTSVVSNWVTESERFAPDLAVVAISDTLRRRGQDLAEVVAGADVVVTSYTLFRLDFDDYSAASWSGLILDEAQFTKNHQSKIYQCARRLPAPFKVGITGTPMENNLMELWSLLSITAPGLFPNPTRFRDYYARPIEKDRDTELLARLRRRVKPLVKRRTKEQVVADLPAKQEQVLEVELAPKHRKIYQTHLQRERQKVLGLVEDLNKNRFTILRSLTVLRQLSLHAGLVDDAHEGLPSAKIDALLEQLADVVDGGHRALVFSQFTGFLDKVRARLDAAGVEYCYLDGKTRKRAAVLDRFKNGSAPVFLISLKAGGFGLNLTEADYCFLLDPWWNPATEAQAVDRTHRIGQTRNVMVYRLIAKDTIEEKVMALKARKAELFTNVMDDGEFFGSTLDAEDIRGLFE